MDFFTIFALVILFLLWAWTANRVDLLTDRMRIMEHRHESDTALLAHPRPIKEMARKVVE